ncbi:MAG: ABC transporter substrate-binding protein [Chromatiales bacterium]|nr:ABC transporter substrate-binding protein [Chromatiales bacterium]
MRILAALALSLCCLTSLAASDTRTPDQIVRQTADTLSARIDGRQKQLEANPPELYKLVDEIFLPVFDTDYAGRLVLGKHWRTATPAQRQQFIDTFYDFLLRSYSRYVLRFEKDKVRILPAPAGTPDPQRAVVRTEMQLEDGTKLPVHYSLHQTKDGWRAYDVRIEGISYVQNYRNQFSAEIGAKGIDAVIARLKSDAERVTTKPVGPKT